MSNMNTNSNNSTNQSNSSPSHSTTAVAGVYPPNQNGSQGNVRQGGGRLSNLPPSAAYMSGATSSAAAALHGGLLIQSQPSSEPFSNPSASLPLNHSSALNPATAAQLSQFSFPSLDPHIINEMLLAQQMPQLLRPPVPTAPAPLFVPPSEQILYQLNSQRLRSDHPAALQVSTTSDDMRSHSSRLSTSSRGSSRIRHALSDMVEPQLVTEAAGPVNPAGHEEDTEMDQEVCRINTPKSAMGTDHEQFLAQRKRHASAPEKLSEPWGLRESG